MPGPDASKTRRKPRKPAVKSGERVSTREPHPPATPLELYERIDRAMRQGWAMQAVLMLQPNAPRGSRGSRSGMWDLKFAELIEIASWYCVDKLTVEQIRERSDAAASKSTRTMQAWVAKIAKEYFALELKHFAKYAEHPEIQAAGGDLLTVQAVFYRELTLHVTRAMPAMDWDQATPGAKHTLLRFGEALNQATYIQNRSKELEARTARIEAELAKYLKAETDGGKKELNAAGVARLISKLMGLDGEDIDADGSGVAA